MTFYLTYTVIKNENRLVVHAYLYNYYYSIIEFRRIFKNNSLSTLPYQKALLFFGACDQLLVVGLLSTDKLVLSTIQSGRLGEYTTVSLSPWWGDCGQE